MTVLALFLLPLCPISIPSTQAGVNLQQVKLFRQLFSHFCVTCGAVELSGAGKGPNAYISNMPQARRTWLLRFGLKNPLRSQGLDLSVQRGQFRADSRSKASCRPCKSQESATLPSGGGFLALAVPAEDSLGSGYWSQLCSASKGS